jgi:hypothetical protein
MKTRFFFILLSLLISTVITNGQGITPPQGEEAVVYFVRVTSYGSNKFEFFHQDNYIGEFRGKEYLRYECEAGKQLFWASSENKEFLTAELNPGGTYIVIVDVVIGFWKNHVGFTPISKDDTELLQRAKELIKNQPPVEVTDAEIQKKEKKLSDFIPEMLQRYENEWKNEHNFRHLSADMAIPEEEMK